MHATTNSRMGKNQVQNKFDKSQKLPQIGNNKTSLQVQNNNTLQPKVRGRLQKQGDFTSSPQG